MERLKNIKRPPLKDKFKKFGDTFNFVSKNKSNRMYCYRRTTPEGIVYFEVFRSNMEKDENGKVMNPIPVHHNLVTQLGVSEIMSTPRRKYKSTCNRNINKKGVAN